MTAMHAVTMPKWGLEMQQGTIVAWHARPGQRIDKGAALADVETDKILGSIEAPVAGVLLRTLVAAGSTLPVGNLIAVLGPPDADETDIESFVSAFSAATAPPTSEIAEAASRASLDVQHGHATTDARAQRRPRTRSDARPSSASIWPPSPGRAATVASPSRTSRRHTRGLSRTSTVPS
jgi:pyruvate dehydrogenase E2 component (dihydrolipoamide acetyltransferase)